MTEQTAAMKKGLTQYLGIEFTLLTSEKVIATMPVTENHKQPFGFLHGGASVVLAETVASVGASINSPDDKIAFGLEINANHLRPVTEGVLTAIATPSYAGRTTQVWEIKITDAKDRLICISRCTLAITDRKPAVK